MMYVENRSFYFRKWWIILCTLLCLNILSNSVAYSMEPLINSNEAMILLDNLLNLSDEPRKNSEKVKKLEKWANIYLKFAGIEKLSRDECKVYLFIVFIAHSNYKSRTLELISKELYLKYLKQNKIFLKVLRRYPFLIPTTGRSINWYFREDGSPYDGKGMMLDEFISKNKKSIFQNLGEKKGYEFIEYIKGNKNY